MVVNLNSRLNKSRYSSPISCILSSPSSYFQTIVMACPLSCMESHILKISITPLREALLQYPMEKVTSVCFAGWPAYSVSQFKMGLKNAILFSGKLLPDKSSFPLSESNKTSIEVLVGAIFSAFTGGEIFDKYRKK